MKKIDLRSLLSDWIDINSGSGGGDVMITAQKYCGDVRYSEVFVLKDNDNYLLSKDECSLASVFKDCPKFISFVIGQFTDNKNYSLQVWPSNKIRYAYLKSNYLKPGCGELGESCMRHKHMQKALNFYVKNKVKIVVLTTPNNKILARALLWENVHYKKKIITYLDRIYTAHSTDLDIYKAFAITNNYRTYRWDGVPDRAYITDVNLEDITHLPWADSFRHLAYKDKILYTNYTNSLSNKLKHPEDIIVLGTTHNRGYVPLLDKNAVREAITEDWISKKDATYIKRYDAWVHKDNIVNLDNIYYHCRDSNVTRLSNNEYCLRTNVVDEALTINRIDKTKAKYIKKYKGYVHNTNCVKLNKEEYSIYDDKICEFNGKFYLKRSCFSCGNNVYIPKNQTLIVYGFTKIEKTIEIENDETVCAPELDKNGNPALSTQMYIPEYQRSATIELVDGTLVLDNKFNRQFIKKHNKKYYLAHEFERVDEHQLLLFR